MFPNSNKDEQLNTKCRAFSYSEVVSITDDFRQMIGKGGFGKVYLGVIPDGENVAVKTLSLSELQGHKEFISEVLYINALVNILFIFVLLQNP